MKKVIIINGHGAPMMSMDNKRILEDVKAQLQDVEIVTLAELYPDFKIDVEKEQTRLLAADLIVFEYPIWWYSAPSILKKYVEDVFAMGFAFGPGGDKLKGKKFIDSFTCGAPEKNYLPGASGEDIEKMALPMKATCWLCGIEYLGQIGTYGAMYYGLDTKEELDAVNAKMDNHAARLINLIKSVCHGN